jgi:amino acid adenylation domain-containing protein
LLKFLREHQSASLIPPPVVQRRNSESAPLSFAQERLWFLEHLEPANSLYNICRASRLLGQLNLPALEASLNEIVRRHEILRSAIRVLDGRPVQVVQPPFELKVPVTDFEHVAGPEREREISRQIQKVAAMPFDFSAGRFLRAALLRLENRAHILILTTHHIVADAWSMGILTRELWLFYEMYAAGNASPLEDLQVQYADFAVWQHEWLQGDVLEAQLAYWKKQLDDLPILNLPTDRLRPSRQSFRGARMSLSFPESLTRSINDLSTECGVTPFMTLLAAFQVLLYRYSGQEDVVIGSPIANRARTKLEPLIGFFVNTLVLRSDLSGNPTFNELLARVREVCLGAYAHQDLPFEKLVQELQPERDQSRNQLFQVMFVLQNATRPFTGIAGLRIEPLELATTRSPFDLSLFLREREDKYIGYIEYSTDLFERDRIERMAGHYQRLLEAIVADPDHPISTLPLLAESERHQLLIRWNDTEAEYPKESCIHEVFEAQVERTPDARAIEFEGKQLTYRELNRRSNCLAHYLRRLGVGPEKLVGICVDRSLEMVIGLLGILKAGGAYVPLDPTYPRERLTFMLKDSEVSVLLTQESHIEDGRLTRENSDPLSSILDSQMKIVCLDTNWETIAAESQQNLHTEVKSDNLAYVIYTSGSTGKPKGVAMTHRPLTNLIVWHREHIPMRRGARVAQFATLGFDVSFQEIFSTLCSGNALVLVSEELRRDPCHFLRFLARRSINRLFVPFVMLEQLAIAAADAISPRVELDEIITAGEQLRITPQIVRWLSSLAPCMLHNHYGPTESHVVISYVMTGTPTEWIALPPIGRPINNVQVYILDRHLQPLPIGVAGDLYIGGHGLARGYLNLPELTAEKFIAYSFNGEPSTRIYSTGDLARYRADGNIEFLGRLDNQVKIRGYRIELGEIESVLNQHPKVKESVVLTQTNVKHEMRNPEASNSETVNQSLGKQLVAYIVPAVRKLSVSELNSFLKGKLPDFMVPSGFVMLEALPLTPNGKVDRQALPLPDNGGIKATEDFVEPLTEIEHSIARIWREVLRLDKVGVNDNFFELGGHSLLAIQVISRVRDIFHKQVSLRGLFESPTVAGLAAKLERTIRKGHNDDLPPIMPVLRDRLLPLSMNQEQLWVLEQMIPGTDFFNIPYVFRLTGEPNIAALERSLLEIIRRHEALRTVFARVNGSPVQVVTEVCDLVLPVIDLRNQSGTDVGQQAAGLILEERERAFDLAAGPLLRTKLIRLTDKECFLLITMHHIISDHWSMLIFRGELVTLYEAFCQGRSSPLTDPQIQFADYAYWERHLLENGLLRHQLAYWKNKLAGSLPHLEFVKSRKTERIESLQSCCQTIELDQHLFTAIRAFARDQHCTPFMVLVTALSIVLHVYTGQRDIRIGTLVANRGRKETEGLIGYFINTVILRISVSGTQTVKRLLRQVRKITLSANAHSDLPFEQVARTVEVELNVERSSLFQVLFNYEVSTPGSVEMNGLTIASLGIRKLKTDRGVTLTMCDLIFNLRETPTKLTGTVNYKIKTFNDRLITEMIRDLKKILEQLNLESDRTVSQMTTTGTEARELFIQQ